MFNTNSNTSNRNYHFQPINSKFGNYSNNKNDLHNYNTKKNDSNNLNHNYNTNFTAISHRALSNPTILSNQPTYHTNSNINLLEKNNANKFSMNLNTTSTMNLQERIINFGHDSNENSFKKNLRKKNGVSNSNARLSAVTSPNNTNSIISKFNKDFSVTKSEKLNHLFHSLKNTSANPLSASSRVNHNSVNYASNNINNNKLNLVNNNETNSNLSNIKTPNYLTNYRNLSSSFKSKNESVYSIKDSSSVQEYSYKEDQNVKCRNTMEDMSKSVDKFGRDSDQGFFTLYDGHGGSDVAKYCKDRMPDLFEKILSSNKDKNKDPNFIENMLTTVFQKIDEELKLTDSENNGSTATVVYITKEKDNSSINNFRKVAYCANVGDSRCTLITSYGAKRLSYDHKASDMNEAMRINNSGGIIFGGRVYGQLILTRALGDHSLKKYGVICTPYVSKHIISERDKYLVIASDGVWDVITDEDMFRLSLQISNSEDYAYLIIKTGLSKGTQDNISCLVLKLN